MQLHEKLTIHARSFGVAESFTKREMQVLRLLCSGLSTKQIAAELGVSFKTAATHRYTVFNKAGTKNAVRLLRWALKKGLVSLDE